MSETIKSEDNIFVDDFLLKAETERKKLKECFNRTGLITLISGLLFTGIAYALIFLLRFILTSALPLHSSIDALPTYLINSMASLTAIGGVGLVFLKLQKINLSESLPVSKVSKSTLVSLLIIGFTVCMLANVLTNLFISSTYSLGIDLNYNSQSPQCNSMVEIAVYIISVAIVPAVSEEILFRGALLSTLRKHSDGFAVFVSAFIFGIFHGNFVQFPFAFIVGLVLGWAVVYTNSMIPAMVIHCTNNGFSVICDIIAQNSDFLNINMTIFGLTINFFVAAMGLLSLILAKKMSEKDKKFLSFEKYNGVLSSSETRRIFFSRPAIIGAMVFLSAETALNHLL